MNPTRRHHLSQLLGATAALTLSQLARAHGESHKDHHKATGPVVKEQKPWGSPQRPRKPSAPSPSA